MFFGADDLLPIFFLLDPAIDGSAIARQNGLTCCQASMISEKVTRGRSHRQHDISSVAAYLINFWMQRYPPLPPLVTEPFLNDFFQKPLTKVSIWFVPD